MHSAYCTDIRHRHRGGMLSKTPPPTELQIPATVTTLTKMPLSMEVGLSPGKFVLDGDPAPSQKGAEPPPQF